MRVDPALIPYLSHFFADSLGDETHGAGLADDPGWITMTIIFESLEDARQRILGCGGAVEVLAPPALRLSVSDFAEQIASLYAR
jgi:hypothetical protein